MRAPSELEAPPLTENDRQDHLDRGCEPIAVYGECEIGNPLKATIVVRYLLNRPGLFQPLVPLSFGANDFFVHFDRAHVPADRQSTDLFMPVVDRSIYYRSDHDHERRGFIVFSHRADLDRLELPHWAQPVVAATMPNPLSHHELAQLYRRCRAMIALERTVAIFESLCCGCPVICIQGDHFTPNNYQRRFRGAGLVWGWHEDQLSSATARTGEFLHLYQKLENAVPRRIHDVFFAIIEKARRQFLSRIFQTQMVAA